MLHEQGLLPRTPLVIVAYPLVPWIGVMGLGFCFGQVYRLPPERRRPLADPAWAGPDARVRRAARAERLRRSAAWAVQSRPLFTLLSFLNTTKYPPSLAFLLMTLGPAIAALG